MVDDVIGLENNPSGPHFYTHSRKLKRSKKSFKKNIPTALLAIIAIIVFIIILFTGESNLPFTLNELTTAEDVSYQTAATTAARIANFSYLLEEGEVDQDLISRLKKNNITIGYLNEDGKFIEGNDQPNLVVNFDNTIYDSNQILTELYNNQNFYNAFYKATYGNLGDYSDQTAEDVFEEIGVNRYISSYQDFDELLADNTSSKVSTSSNVSYVSEKTDDKGNITYEYIDSTKTSSSNLEDLKNNISGSDEYEATLNYASMLNATEAAIEDHQAETTAMTYNVIIDAIKAGEGNKVDLDGAMNLLTDDAKYYELNTETGELEEKYGAPIDAISVAVNHEDLSTLNFDSYSSDRIIKTTNNLTNSALSMATTSSAQTSDLSTIIKSTIVSAPSIISNTVTCFLTNLIQTPITSVVSIIEPSTINLTTTQTTGTALGYTYLRGEIKISERLAKARGGAVGDSEAVASYQQYQNQAIAMNAAAERSSLSPFDTSSDQTFLGTILSSFKTNKNPITNLIFTTATSLSTILPSSYATNQNSLTSATGNCETISAINGEGNVFCSTNITFPVETILNAYHDQNFLNFVNQWTYLDNQGNRRIKSDTSSPLYQYLIYYTEQLTTPGNTNSSVLSALSQNSSNSTAKLFSTASDTNRALANGSAFLNSSSNPKWASDYQYALTYIILASVMDQYILYANDETAYQNLTLFEGSDNPVIAFLDEYYEENPIDNSYEGYLARATGYTKSEIIAILEFMQTDDYIAYKLSSH